MTKVTPQLGTTTGISIPVNSPEALHKASLNVVTIGTKAGMTVPELSEVMLMLGLKEADADGS